MRSVGILATTVAAVLAVGALIIGVRSVPDIKRYLKIRSM